MAVWVLGGCPGQNDRLWHLCPGGRVSATILVAVLNPIRKNLCFVFVLDFDLLVFGGLKKNLCPTPSLSHHTLMTIRLLPCWHLSPWETMLGVWPVAGLEVGKALEHPTLTSFPVAPPRPAPPQSQCGKENLADSVSPAGVGTPGTAD